MRPLLVAAVFVLFAVGARAAEPEYRARGDLAIKARDVFKRYCAECHTGRADPGHSRLKLLDHAQVTGKKTPIPLATAGGRSLLMELLNDGSMPPANRAAPTKDEVAVLRQWIDAKAPGYPAAFDEAHVLTSIADEIENDPERSQSTQYVSFAHLVRDGQPFPNLGAAEQQLRIALALSSPTGTGAALEPVDDAGTVFRFDLAKQGWWVGNVFERIEGRKAAGDTGPTRLEVLIESEYPFGRALLAADPVAPRLKEFMFFRGLSVPYLRGDWLSSALLPSDWATRAAFGEVRRAALADDILALAALRRPKPGDGPSARPFTGPRSIVVPAPADGRKPFPPLSAWYAGDVVPEKPPFVLKAELVADDKVVTKVKLDEPFFLRVSCDKKVHFTLLNVLADGEVRLQPVQGGTVILANQGRALAPNAAGFQIGSILNGGDSGVEHFVLFASESELPVPTIIRSKHLDKPVWRFVFEPTAKFSFDPNAVVRKVIPIPVTRK